MFLIFCCLIVVGFFGDVFYEWLEYDFGGSIVCCYGSIRVVVICGVYYQFGLLIRFFFVRWCAFKIVFFIFEKVLIVWECAVNWWVHYGKGLVFWLVFGSEDRCNWLVRWDVLKIVMNQFLILWNVYCLCGFWIKGYWFWIGCLFLCSF